MAILGGLQLKMNVTKQNIPDEGMVGVKSSFQVDRKNTSRSAENSVLKFTLGSVIYP